MSNPLIPRTARTLAFVLLALDRLAKTALVVLMVEVLVMMTGQALDRYFFHTNFDAYEQLAGVGVVWITFFGFALGYHEGANLRVELVDSILPAPVVAAKRIVFDVLLFGMSAIMNSAGWRVLEVASNQDIIGTPFTNGIVYWSLQTATILVCAFAIVRIGTQLAAFVGTGGGRRFR